MYRRQSALFRQAPRVSAPPGKRIPRSRVSIRFNQGQPSCSSRVRRLPHVPVSVRPRQAGVVRARRDARPERSKTLTRRRILWAFGLIVALAALGGTALIAAGPFDVATIVTRRASASLGRPVTVAAARLHVGATATVELSDLVIDNAPGGTTWKCCASPPSASRGRTLVAVALHFTDRLLVVRRLSVEGVRLPSNMRLKTAQTGASARRRHHRPRIAPISRPSRHDARSGNRPAGPPRSLGALPLGGAIDVRSHIRAKAKTLAEAAVRSNRGIIVLSMRGGSIERKVIEGASTDARLLFRAPEGNNWLSCLVTVMELRDGVGRIATRVRASDGNAIAAGGTIRLRDETLDVTLSSESASTGLFALDVPLRIFGSIHDPSVRPVLGGVKVQPRSISIRRKFRRSCYRIFSAVLASHRVGNRRAGQTGQEKDQFVA